MQEGLKNYDNNDYSNGKRKYKVLSNNSLRKVVGNQNGVANEKGEEINEESPNLEEKTKQTIILRGATEKVKKK